ERACPDVRPARDLALGSDRGCVLEAVRLPPALPRPWSWRRLHSGRPALPRLATARVRLLGPPDRGRAPAQRGDAAVRRPEDLGCAERFRLADQGLTPAVARDGVQGR